MNFITKEELDKKNLVSRFTITDKTLKVEDGLEFSPCFSVSDIVTYKSDTTKIGVVYFIEDDEVSVKWHDGCESVESSSNLLVVPPSLGLELIENSSLLEMWENLSNGKNEDFDLKCLYIGDTTINEVPFIKSFKNTNVILDKKFKREFTLFRKFGPSQIFRTNLYTINNGSVFLDKSRYVYYLLEDSIIYFLGIDLSEQDLAIYLFNR